MTDLERFVELYRSFGIECILTKTEEDSKDSIYTGGILIPKGSTVIRLGDSFMHGHDEDLTKDKRFGGYSDFYTSIHFDPNGKFLFQGFWE